jgi:hypothetical protein
MRVVLLKITIEGIDPPIWRQIKISSDATLQDLHYVIQNAFGWTNNHLFLFNIGSMKFVHTPDWEEDAYRFQAAELASLGGFIPKLVSKGSKFSYIYDMGDNWVHEILVENIEDSPETFTGAICLDGKRAGPPENIGSVPGYYRLLDDLRDSTHEEYALTWGWLGFIFEPEACDLDSANLFIHDYFDAAQLSLDSLWARYSPVFKPAFDFIHAWTDESEHLDYAEGVPLRRDVVTLLTYLHEHKVKGTKATGNFPRKVIREITAGFVNPPILDQQIGDREYKLRTEDEVPDLSFIHHFVNLAGLIVGGENKPWRVTYLGNIFLDRTPLEQVWFLTKFWFYDFDWDNCYPFEDVILNDHLYAFQKVLIKVFLGYPTGWPVEITKVLADLDQTSPGWISVFCDYKRPDFTQRHYFEKIVVEPFEKLGLFETVKEESELFKGYYDFTHVIMTNFGKTLLKFFG